MDSGGCSSVVNKATFNCSMKHLCLREVSDLPLGREVHRFGGRFDKRSSMYASKLSFKGTCTHGRTYKYNIECDEVDGELFFMIGLPSLKAMKDCASFKCVMISDSRLEASLLKYHLPIE